MPIEIISNLAQKNRAANVSSTAFFYLMDTSNIDYRINGIQEDNTLSPSLVFGSKYIIRNISSLHGNFDNLSAIGVANNDIVMRSSNSWILYVDVSNTKTNKGGIVYNDSDDKLYYYNGSEWRSLGLGSLIGTPNQIQIAGSTGDVRVGLTPIVIIQNYIQTPELRFTGSGSTMGGITDAIQITGNLNIKGTLLVDGEVVTKTAFRGYSSDQEIESITDIQLDAGDY